MCAYIWTVCEVRRSKCIKHVKSVCSHTNFHTFLRRAIDREIFSIVNYCVLSTLTVVNNDPKNCLIWNLLYTMIAKDYLKIIRRSLKPLFWNLLACILFFHKSTLICLLLATHVPCLKSVLVWFQFLWTIYISKTSLYSLRTGADLGVGNVGKRLW